MANVKKNAGATTTTATKKTTVASDKKVVAPEKKTTPVAEKKETEKVVPVVKETEKKAAAPKTAAKKPAKKTVKKETAVRTQDVFFEYDEKQVSSNEIIAKIEETFKAEGHRVSTIKSLSVYVNAAENRAYYVINGKEEGKFIEL